MQEPAQETSPPAGTAVTGAAATNFQYRVRVYWEDTDAGGVVFYANYLKFFERARTEWLRALGVGQRQLREDAGTIFIVSQTDVRYLRPARLDDSLRVSVELREQGRASLTVFQQAWREATETPESTTATDAPDAAALADGKLPGAAELLAEGSIRIGCVDAQTFKPRRIPAKVLEKINP